MTTPLMYAVPVSIFLIQIMQICHYFQTIRVIMSSRNLIWEAYKLKQHKRKV